MGAAGNQRCRFEHAAGAVLGFVIALWFTTF